MTRLPLFPLGVVLFPQSALPLHIFEDRYKTLIGECLEQRGKEFGINLFDNDVLSMVGCTAVVRDVVRRHDDGRLDIVVEGKQRFQLRRIDKKSAPYFIGDVVFFEEECEEVNASLAEKVRMLYNQLVDAAYMGQLPKVRPGEFSDLSFVVVQKSGLRLRERQQLLELRSENDRLDCLHTYLAAVLPRLAQAEEVERIVHNDGYIIN